MKTRTTWRAMMVAVLCLSLGVGPALSAQAAPQTATPQGSRPTAGAQVAAPRGSQATAGAQAAVPPGGQKEDPNALLRPEEIDQLMAPIALYPDDLVAQVLAASTYPVEIVQAARFVKENAKLKGEQLMAAARDKDWEPSVKAMLQFPDVLAMMDEKLDWTSKVGDAFLSQRRDAMDSIQRLRRKADEAGNLKTTQEQKVIVEEQTQTIVIQPANPQVVYVPTYNPTVVYGTWPYPAYPPYPVYPPGYVAATSLLSFGVGVAVGAAWSGWGGWHSDWHGGDVDIDINRNNNFTRNNYVNSERYQMRQNGRSQSWQHNPENRRGQQYRNNATAQKYGQSRAGTRQASSTARGYAGGAGTRTAAGAGTRDLSRAGGAGAGTRDLSRAGGAGAGTRATTSPRASAFSGAGAGGGDRAASFRGQSSRGSSSFAGRGGGRAGGMARGGGGRGGGRR